MHCLFDAIKAKTDTLVFYSINYKYFSWIHIIWDHHHLQPIYLCKKKSCILWVHYYGYVLATNKVSQQNNIHETWSPFATCGEKSRVTNASLKNQWRKKDMRKGKLWSPLLGCNISPSWPKSSCKLLEVCPKSCLLSQFGFGGLGQGTPNQNQAQAKTKGAPHWNFSPPI